MAQIDIIYHNLVREIYTKGFDYEDPKRKGVIRREIPQYTLNIPLTEAFPAITLKELSWKWVVGELLWFMSGDPTIYPLMQKGIRIWDKDAYARYVRMCKRERWEFLPFKEWREAVKYYYDQSTPFTPKTEFANGYLGPVYGPQWRDATGVDQLQKLVDTLKGTPMSSELIVSAWSAAQIEQMALPPCHYEFQVVARRLTREEKIAPPGTGKQHGIYLVWSQRSCDTFLGIPFNIASYALLTHILARLTNTVPLGIIGNLKKVHLYDNSFEAVQELLDRDPEECPDVQLAMADNVSWDGTIGSFVESALSQDFVLQGYESYPPLKVEMLARDA